MNLSFDDKTLWLVGGVAFVLSVATAVGRVLKRRADTGLNPAAVEVFNHRVNGWWLMCSVLAVTLLLGKTVTVILFGLISFWALREFITLTPTRTADHRTLFWVFFFFTPLQYVLVGMGESQYGLYSIMIPVYGMLFVPARAAFAGDARRFLERAAKIQAGLMVCVYCLSYAPALMSLKIEGYPTPGREGRNAGLLLFFVLVVQLGDAMRYVWDQLVGRRVIAPAINPTKTWEGFVGGIGSATLLGTALWWVTPFPIWMATLMSLLISFMGFCGGLTMSAIKRDRGVSDYGTLVEGHVGVLDRLDSICFAAPVFFHVTRFLAHAGWIGGG